MKKNKRKNLIMILSLSILAFLIFYNSEKTLYDSKTDIFKKDDAFKIIDRLDWKEFTIEETATDGNEILIKFADDEPDFKEEDLKTLIVNGIYVLILVEYCDIISYGYDNPSMSVDVETANMILKTNYNKTVDDYRASKEDFNNLLEELPNIEIITDSVFTR